MELFLADTPSLYQYTYGDSQDDLTACGTLGARGDRIGNVPDTSSDPPFRSPRDCTHRQGKISIYATSEGEEAVAVGAGSAIGEHDWLFPDYRCAGALFSRGVSMSMYLSQLLGTARDSNKGRQMPTHIASRELRIASVSTPVGNGIPHAVGLAWAAKLRKGPEAVLVVFGDGATSSDGFHAGMNVAGVHRLPIVFLVETISMRSRYLSKCRRRRRRLLSKQRPTASRAFVSMAMMRGLCIRAFTMHWLERELELGPLSLKRWRGPFGSKATIFRIAAAFFDIDFRYETSDHSLHDFDLDVIRVQTLRQKRARELIGRRLAAIVDLNPASAGLSGQRAPGFNWKVATVRLTTFEERDGSDV